MCLLMFNLYMIEQTLLFAGVILSQVIGLRGGIRYVFEVLELPWIKCCRCNICHIYT